jgi:chaperonin GroEL
VTRILTDNEPREALFRGAEKLYKAVSSTMGPQGSNVIFRKAGKRVAVTHDGATVAKAVKIDDAAEDVGADLLREAAANQEAATGDGTTTVTVLAYNLLKGANDLINQGQNPMAVKRELDKVAKDVVAKIEAAADKDITQDKIVAVATVAAGDPEIGRQVGESIFIAGEQTPVILEFSDSSDTTVDVIKGFKIASGPASPYLLENPAGYEVLTPRIVVCDAKLRDKDDVLPILRLISALSNDPNERNVLVVATDVGGDALSLLTVNHLKGFANIAVARVPQGINNPALYLGDLAASCGATLLSRNTGHTIADPTMDHFGAADKVRVTPAETVILNGHADQEVLATHIESLEAARNSKSAGERKLAEDRLLTLKQTAIAFYVGGQSETEADEKHYRYEDAIGAAKAAMRGGVVPGGGTLLFKIGSPRLAKNPNDVMGNALVAPMAVVMNNAGIDGDFDASNFEVGKGFDVLHPEDGVVDLVARGIIDPALSEVECVKTAVSIAGLLLTAGALIVDEQEEKNDAQPAFSVNQG